MQEGRRRERDVLNGQRKTLVTEFGIELPPGSPVGELGFLTPNNQRTATVECTDAAQVLTITYERLLELYFQNPQFGYYFLVVTSQRLLQNIACGENYRTKQNGDRPAGGNHRTEQNQAAIGIGSHHDLNSGSTPSARLDRTRLRYRFCKATGGLFAGNFLRSCGQATSGRGAAFAKQKRNTGKPQQLYHSAAYSECAIGGVNVI
jgi:hypothetical protein